MLYLSLCLVLLMAALLCVAVPSLTLAFMYAYEKVGHYQNKAMPPNIYYCITADYNDVSFNLETFSTPFTKSFM